MILQNFSTDYHKRSQNNSVFFSKLSLGIKINISSHFAPKTVFLKNILINTKISLIVRKLIEIVLKRIPWDYLVDSIYCSVDFSAYITGAQNKYNKSIGRHGFSQDDNQRKLTIFLRFRLVLIPPNGWNESNPTFIKYLSKHVPFIFLRLRLTR